MSKQDTDRVVHEKGPELTAGTSPFVHVALPAEERLLVQINSHNLRSFERKAVAAELFAAKEYALGRLPGDSTPDRLLAAELALDYLQAGRSQEGIWTLREGGHVSTANELASRLRDFLSTAEILEREKNRYGIEESEVVRLDGGVKAILKADDCAGGMVEVATYQLDEIFEFDLVPMTVWRPELEASLLIWIEDARPTFVNCKEGTYPPGESWKKLYVLDYFIENGDRSIENTLYRPGEKLVGIDHYCKTWIRDLIENNLHPEDADESYEPYYVVDASNLPRSGVRERLAVITDDTLLQKLAWLPSPATKENFLTKMGKLREAYGLL